MPQSTSTSTALVCLKRGGSPEQWFELAWKKQLLMLAHKHDNTLLDRDDLATLGLMGLTIERLRQLEAHALRTLRTGRKTAKTLRALYNAPNSHQTPRNAI